MLANDYSNVVPIRDLGFTLEQKLQRMTGMSATDIVRISGLAPPCMGGAIGVYAEKTGEGLTPDDEMSEDLERGIFGEPFLRNWYAHRTGRHVRMPGSMQSQEHPLIHATPDGISFDPADPEGTQRVLEIKMPRYGFAWGEDEAPPYYRIQVQVQMGVSGVHQGDIVALVNGGLRVYPQQFSAGQYAELVKMAEYFWHRHVIPGVPPPPDATQAYAQWLARIYPEQLDEDLIPADGAALAWLAQYNDAAEEARAAEARKREARNNLVALVGGHLGLCDADGNKLVTYKKCKDSEFVDHKALAASLSPRTVNRFRGTKPGHRSIKVYA